MQRASEVRDPSVWRRQSHVRALRHQPSQTAQTPQESAVAPPTLRSVQTVLDVSNEVAAELAGIGDPVLNALRDRLGCTVNLRGNRLTLAGDDLKVAEAQAVVEELVELVEGGQEVGAATVDAILGAIDQAEDVDAIRDCTVTFGIGPAGTGKTYLAIALAVAALSERQVGRIILTRPAVEAGERLGFLPGDVLATVDPYMRPLFDALYDTMDPEKLNAFT